MGKRMVYWVIGLLVMIIGWSPIVTAQSVYEIARDAGYAVEEKDTPKAALIADGWNGQLLWQKDIDRVHDPASIAKVMTVYLVMEAIEQGKLSMDQTIQASKQDEAMASIYALSNNHIISGVSYPVSELLKMTLVASSNTATVMLSRAISESDGEFIRMMNDKARALGMTRTHFFNATGAVAELFEGLYHPEGVNESATNESTARDLAILAIDLWRRFPEVTEITRHASVTVMKGSIYEEQFQTYNYSVPGAAYGINGVIGLKTGSSGPGAFNYIALYEKDGLRLVEVILGVGDWSDQRGEEIRHMFGNALLSYVLERFSYETLLEKGAQQLEGETVMLSEPLKAVVAREWQPHFKRLGHYVIYQSPYELLNDQQQLASAALVSPNHSAASQEQPTVQELSWYQRFSWLYGQRWSWLAIIMVVLILLLLMRIRIIKRRRKRRRRQRRR